MKPFIIKAALAGEPVLLRNGEKAYVRHHETELPVASCGELWGVGIREDGSTTFLQWTKDGVYKREGGMSQLDIAGMAPRTRELFGEQVPLPETKAPEEGTPIYTPWPHSDPLYREWVWTDSRGDRLVLERGLVFLRPEDASATTKALLKGLKYVQ